MAQLTNSEVSEILRESHVARERGDINEWMRLSQKLPLDPDLAQAAKELFGAEVFKTLGFNLSAVEEKYGPAWLDR